MTIYYMMKILLLQSQIHNQSNNLGKRQKGLKIMKNNMLKVKPEAREEMRVGLKKKELRHLKIMYAKYADFIKIMEKRHKSTI